VSLLKLIITCDVDLFSIITSINEEEERENPPMIQVVIIE
jgi:hypothetical protein